MNKQEKPNNEGRDRKLVWVELTDRVEAEINEVFARDGEAPLYCDGSNN